MRHHRTWSLGCVRGCITPQSTMPSISLAAESINNYFTTLSWQKKSPHKIFQQAKTILQNISNKQQSQLCHLFTCLLEIVMLRGASPPGQTSQQTANHTREHHLLFLNLSPPHMLPHHPQAHPQGATNSPAPEADTAADDTHCNNLKS